MRALLLRETMIALHATLDRSEYTPGKKADGEKAKRRTLRPGRKAPVALQSFAGSSTGRRGGSTFGDTSLFATREGWAIISQAGLLSNRRFAYKSPRIFSGGYTCGFERRGR